MNKYGILLLPSHNRVYTDSETILALGELQLASLYFGTAFTNISEEIIGNVPYITFETEVPLTEDILRILSRLSFTYAIFKLGPNGMGPIDKIVPCYFDEDLVTIQKYSGKTNELFTRFLVNIAILSGKGRHLCPEAPIRILDPICGRGTTLLEGLIQGYQCTGVEIDKKQVEQLVQFFTRYLKTKKYKHRVEKRNVADHTGTLGQAYQFTMARTKESYKAGDVLSMKVIRGDTQQIPRLLRKETFHHIIGDLPYGVQHGSSSPSGSFTRNPSQLLEKSLPGWIQVLEPDGTLALSWNTFVLKRERIIDILQAHGLMVFTQPPYDQFLHRVDQAILRDVIVAQKKS